MGGRGRCVVQGGVRMGLAWSESQGFGSGSVEDVARHVVRGQERLDGGPEVRLGCAGLIKESGTFRGRT